MSGIDELAETMAPKRWHPELGGGIMPTHKSYASWDEVAWETIREYVTRIGASDDKNSVVTYANDITLNSAPVTTGSYWPWLVAPRPGPASRP